MVAAGQRTLNGDFPKQLYDPLNSVLSGTNRTNYYFGESEGTALDNRFSLVNNQVILVDAKSPNRVSTVAGLEARIGL